MTDPQSTVFMGDCMDFMAQFPDKHFELAIVDPPYRDENQPTKDMRRNGSMKTICGRPKENYFAELFRVSQNHIIWGANNFQLPQWKGFVVWKKKTISENFTMSMCEVASLSEGLSTVSKIIEIQPQDINRIHPTQKPIKLYTWLLGLYAKPGDKILDTHMGSQSSRVACWREGFDYWGSELDPDYFKAGCERFDKETQQPLLLRA